MSGALREGHFQLKSGRHSDRYMEKFEVLQDPAATSELVRDVGGGVRGPRPGGPGRRADDRRRDPRVRERAPAGTRAIFAEEVRGDDGAARREFRRGFRIAAGERVLLVDDILTTGGSLLAMIPAVERFGGEIVGCHVLVDRSGGLAALTSPLTARSYPLSALWRLDLPTYEPGEETCPGCRDGVPLHAPGSSGAVAAT